MTHKEIIDIEQENTGYINLHLEGTFYKAYEQSAFAFCTRIKGSLKDWRGLPDSKSLFHAPPGCGLPIGNLTSQLFSNIYLNELDQFCKRELGFRHYGRYVDDFYLVDDSKERLEGAVPLIDDFLRTHLRLSLNASKTRIISCRCGVPFLGAVACPNGRFLRSRTRRHLDRRWTEALCTESDPYVLLSVRNAREGFLKHFGRL